MPETSSCTKYFHTHDVRAVVVVSDINSNTESEGVILEAGVETTKDWELQNKLDYERVTGVD